MYLSRKRDIYCFEYNITNIVSKVGISIKDEVHESDGKLYTKDDVKKVLDEKNLNVNIDEIINAKFFYRQEIGADVYFGFRELTKQDENKLICRRYLFDTHVEIDKF
ncbi:MAG: hypothetical protein PF569_05510 [Candidatus Woesearchaeota archaeon]|jgi:hypothetical protein|nr:hypothetical protein [Candidatus Woesearchaeota archaeon]